MVGDDRVLVVGQLNPYGGDPSMALVNYPDGCSGHRLWRILGLPEERYLALGRVNLCVGEWQISAATSSASRIYDDLREPSRKYPDVLVVLLGSQVARAFRSVTVTERGGQSEPGILPLWSVGRDALSRARWLCMPHPSGLNRSWGSGMWQSGGTVDRARGLLRSLSPHVPWGTEHPLIDSPQC